MPASEKVSVPRGKLVAMPPAAAVKLCIHPFAEVFPRLCGKALERLAEDIRQNGQLYPAIIFDGMLLDGVARRDACVTHGIPLKVADLPTTLVPMAFLVSSNLARRHMNEAQRAMAAARFANLRRGQTPSYYTPAHGDVEAITRQKAADTFAISICSVSRAKKILKDCSPELVALIDAGEMSLAAAENYRPRRASSGETQAATEMKDREAGRAARRLIEAIGAEAALTVLGIVQSVGSGRVKAAIRAISTASADAARFAAPEVDPVMAARVAKSAATRAARKRKAALSPARPIVAVLDVPVSIVPPPLAEVEAAIAT